MSLAPKTNAFAAALSTLIVLQLIMLGALFAQIPPHPPMHTPIFGIGPLIGAGVSAALAAILMGGQSTIGRVLAIIAALIAALSFGPQKYFDAQFPAIWPAVLAGQVAIFTIFAMVFIRRQGRLGGTDADRL